MSDSPIDGPQGIGRAKTLEARVDLTNQRVSELREDVQDLRREMRDDLNRLMLQLDTGTRGMLGGIGASWLYLMIATFF